MSNSVRSPEVITSIIFGIFASALGVLQVILFLVYRKNRKGSVEVGESVFAKAQLRLTRKPGIAKKKTPRQILIRAFTAHPFLSIIIITTKIFAASSPIQR